METELQLLRDIRDLLRDVRAVLIDLNPENKTKFSLYARSQALAEKIRNFPLPQGIATCEIKIEFESQQYSYPELIRLRTETEEKLNALLKNHQEK